MAPYVCIWKDLLIKDVLFLIKKKNQAAKEDRYNMILCVCVFFLQDIFMSGAPWEDWDLLEDR